MSELPLPLLLLFLLLYFTFSDLCVSHTGFQAPRPLLSLLPPAQCLLSGCVQWTGWEGGHLSAYLGRCFPPGAPMPETRDLHTARRTWRMEGGKGHFVRVWGLPGIRSSARPNPGRARRVTRPRNQSRGPKSTAAPHPRKRDVSRGCGATVRVMQHPKQPLAGAAPQ